MSSIRLEIDEIVDDKIDQNRKLFLVRLKRLRIEVWLPYDKLSSANFIIQYVVRLIPRLPSEPSEIDGSIDKIFKLLKEPAKNELNNLVKTFVTVRGLRLPDSKYCNILRRLRNIIQQSVTDYETVKKIRLDILIEEIIERRKQQLENLRITEMQINIISDHRKAIKVTNDYDLEEFPSYLRYINKQISTLGEITKDAMVVRCECKNNEDCRLSSCLHYDFEKEFQNIRTTNEVVGERVVAPYDEKGRCLHPYPKFECNENCNCDASCPRRVVQKGSNVQLEIFRTFSGCGWGVRTLEAIEKGTFVSKYAGEIILWEEANKRKCHEYLFDIDFEINTNDGHPKYTVDAYKYGNISRFVNHNCKPNLSIQVINIENISLELGEICFFAARDILAYEELSIDYKDLVIRHNRTCRCSTCF